jgi:hypothetical protein
VCVDRRVAQALDEGGDRDGLDTSRLVDPAGAGEVEIREPGDVARPQPDGAGHQSPGPQPVGTPTHCVSRVERGLGIPRVQDPAVEVQRGDTDAPGAARGRELGHGRAQ